MGIGSKLKRLLEEKNTNVNALANRANVKPTTLYSIIERDNTKVDIDVLIAISKVLGVSVEYFGENYKGNEPYYLNPETARLAQEVYDNPDLRILFDASRDLRPEDIQFVIDLVNRMKHDSED